MDTAISVPTKRRQKDHVMRKIIPALVAIAALAVPATSLASNPGNGSVKCTDSSLAGTTINSNVTVPAGAHCDLSWADVKGNVSISGDVTNYGATHYEGNVTVNPGGSFAAANWGITIDKSLTITDPRTYSYNGFWGNQGGTTNEIKGDVTYTITSAANYPNYQSPLLYFGGGTKVDGNFTYSDQGVGFPGHLDTGGLTVLGTQSITQR
jgi:hypothetical protein